MVSVAGGVAVTPSTPPVGPGVPSIGSSLPVGVAEGAWLGGVDGGVLGGVDGGADGGVLGGAEGASLGGVDGDSVQLSEFVLLDEIDVVLSALTAKTTRTPPELTVNGEVTVIDQLITLPLV
jgi:hypothetical protein